MLKMVPPWRGWGPVVLLPGTILAIQPAWPPWLFMWLLAGSIYAGLKWLSWRRTPMPETSWPYHAGYLLAWPGLDAVAFLQPAASISPRPQTREWIFALGKSLLGIALFLAAGFTPQNHDFLMGWVGMAGVVFVLHFGLFHLLSCAWRQMGRRATPLMNWPVLSTSLSEFWGQRWNRAFRDISYRFLFRPLLPWLGATWALFFVFILSGLIHDLVISIPAHGGYGGPTLFFAIQGLAIMVERSRPGRGLGLGRGWRGWLFTAFVLIAPAGLLFHLPFVRIVVVPFVQAFGVHS